jgi:small GTP-binding protein
MQLLEKVIEKAYQEGWERLDLSHEKLYALPDSISKCTNLKLLDLSCNRFDKIPESITQLIYLEELYINDNYIKIVADDIQKLSNLQVLDLRNNNLDSISESIGKLVNLRMLGLNSKRKVNAIPKWIQNLKKLEILGISQIELDEKVQLFLSLDRLCYIVLDDVEFARPPLEIFENGIEAIRQYFKQIEAEGVDYLYEAKLLIVGEGGAGKTTLANKIINPNYQLCEEDSTKGIEVLHWSFPRSDGNQFNVNIWDFGGQEIYHSTHQYFLTKRSLYLLVADTRKEDTDFYYWLNVIELLSDNSPILIIKNEKQDRQREINVNQLRGEFGSFKDVFATNLATNRDLGNV